MAKSPYPWSESRWVEEPEGSLAIFYDMRNSWLSMWFMEPEPPASGSDVVALLETSGGPLAAPELGSCGE